MKSILVLFALIGMSAHASYEKSIMWGGRSAGVAGIATPYIQGSTSLYFNPAGLASDKVGHDIALNVTGNSSQYKGPIAANDTQETSKAQFVTPFGLTYSYTPNDKMGFGIGYYVSGGSRAKYEGVDIAGTNGDFEVSSDLAVSELALGGAYKVSDKLKIGLAWRMVMANGNFHLVQNITGANYANVELKDLKDTQYNGFKIGAQYKLTDSTTLGFMYRSQTDIAAKGKIGGTRHTAGATTTMTESDATVHTSFPQAATIGVMQKFNDSWNGLAEYNWAQYSRVRTVDIDGALVLGAPFPTSNNPMVQQHWSDRHTIRVAGEYTGVDWPVRFGLAYASRTTSKAWARASFVPPGPTYAVTAGTGHTWGNIALDLGAEYNMGSADSENPGSTDIKLGKYEVVSYGLNAGVSYSF